MGTFGSGLFGASTGSGSPDNTGTWSIAKILYHALRKARVTNGPGRTPSVDQIGDAFFLLRALLDLWNAQRLTIVNVSRLVFDLVAGTADYTIGPTGGWVTAGARPPLIEWAGRILSGVETPIEVFSLQRWAEISIKNLQSIPSGIRYQPTMPNGTVTVYPVPAAADQLALYVWDTVSDPASAEASLTLSPGFALAIIDNLALDCIETFGTSALLEAKAFDRLERSARTAKGTIGRLNAAPAPRSASDVPGSGDGGYYDYRTRGLD